MKGSAPAPFLGRCTVWKPAGMKVTESPAFTVSLLGKNALAVFVSPSFFAVAAGGPAYMALVLACAAAGDSKPTVAISATVRNETINGAPLRGVRRQTTAMESGCQAIVWLARGRRSDTPTSRCGQHSGGVARTPSPDAEEIAIVAGMRRLL